MADAARVNHLGQPIGAALSGWTPPPVPPHTPMTGRWCGLGPLSPTDAPALWEAFGLDTEGRDWTYLSHGPYERYADFEQWTRASSASVDPQFHAVRLRGAGGRAADGRETDLGAGPPVGVVSYLRIAPAMGTIEVGHIHFSPRLQRTPSATEAMYLMMRRAFELGYRRYEWKCDALNAPSRRAAQRLGFSFEGVFRQAMVTKGRNRDTAWYACIDSEWPALKAAFERWLAPGNFDAAGRQVESLSSLTAPILVSRG